MTDIDVPPGVIHQGAGVVARWIGVVAVIPAHASHQAAVESMFTELGTNPDPADVVRAIRELTIDSSTLVSAAYLMAATGGPMALAHGPVEILVDDEVVLTGADGPNEIQITYGDRLTLRASDDAAAASPMAPFDLRQGVVPGAGITLGGAGLPSTGISSPLPPAPPPEHAASTVEPREASVIEPAPEKIEAPFRSVLLFGQEAPTVDERQPLPLATARPKLDEITADRPAERAASPGSTAPVHPDPEPTVEPVAEHPSAADPGIGDDVIVHGIVCSRDHFNNPAAAFCMVCGISMVHVTHNLVPGPRPTLGFVVFDDGSTFGLDRSYLVGREPGETGDRLTAPLPIQDNNETLSRRHAEIRLIDWGVHLVDLGSTNGTFIWDAQYERWNQITPNQPVALTPGDTVALGRRTFVFESVTRL